MVKYFVSALLLLAIIIGGGWWLMNRNMGGTPANTTPETNFNTAPATSTPDTTNASSSSSATTSTSPSGITMAEVKKHNSATSCYTAINGSVYDVTKWISQHPGGADAILSLCGTDGTAAFEGQHGGERRAAGQLASIIIGALAH